jgi:hypothetical protein
MVQFVRQRLRPDLDLGLCDRGAGEDLLHQRSFQFPERLKSTPHGPLFEYALADRKLQFKPFCMVQDETYNTYFLIEARRKG